MNCPLCDSRTQPYDVNRMTRPVDPVVFRLAREQRVCPLCGWESAGAAEVRGRNLCRHLHELAMTEQDWETP
jgi:hypothetical protein